MDPKVKNFLGYAAMFALIIGSVASLGYVHVYSNSIEPGSYRSFSVSAEGEAVVIPDVAEFTFEVISEGGLDLADLQQANTQKMNGAVAFVKSKGVEQKDIKTQSYNVEPRYQYFDCSHSNEQILEIDESPEIMLRECPPPKIVGYTINTNVLVKVRNFEEIGGILSGVVKNGANSVSGLQFTVDDPTMVENEARAKALVKAKDKAEALADAGDFRLGRLLFISEGGGATPFYDKRMFAEGMGGDVFAAAPAPTIEPGSQEFHVTMTLTYEIR